jgi:hypothetical protein
VMCSAHYKQKTALVPNFVKKLHAKELPKGCSPQNLRYFHIKLTTVLEGRFLSPPYEGPSGLQTTT